MIARLLAMAAILLIGGAAMAADNPLPVDQAFRLQVDSDASGGLTLTWQIAEGYYLYRDHISAAGPDGAALPVHTSPGKRKDDPNFGPMEVYFDRATARIEAPGQAPFALTYQGCQEDGICYRPETRTIDPVDLTVSAPVRAAAPRIGLPAGAAEPAEPGFRLAEDTGLVSSLLADGGAAWVIAAFLFFGLMLSFTPCVFPMYPILAGILNRQGARLNARTGFVLSTAYVLSLAGAFALIGAVAGWSGRNLQLVLQSPFTVGAIAGIFAILALSMFGLFELRLPQGWTSSISRRSGARQGVSGAALLGFSSALIVGPCVTAPLAGALLYIARTADVALGAAALFALGIGKGLPLIAIGTLGAQALPRAGVWMERVKHLFGFGFLATAVWLGAPLLPPRVDLVLWAALLSGLAFYLVSAAPSAGGAGIAGRSIAFLAGVYACILLAGAASGGTDPLKPLAQFAKAGTAASSPAPSFIGIDSAAGLQEALRSAEARPTLVYFTADWCVACHVIERSVLTDDAVRRQLAPFQLLKADLTDITEQNEALMRQLQVAGPPTMLFFDNTAGEVPGSRLVGAISASHLARTAERTVTGAGG